MNPLVSRSLVLVALVIAGHAPVAVAEDLPRIHQLAIKEGAHDVAFSSDGKLIATGGFEGEIRLWDAATGQEIKVAFPKFTFDARLKKIPTFNANVHVAFRPDSQMLAASCAHKLLLWDIPKKKALSNFPAHIQVITDIEFSPDGETLATAGLDEKVTLWPVDKVKAKPTPSVTLAQSLVHPKKDDGQATSLSFSGDSSFIATVRGTGLMVWTLDNPRQSEIATGPVGFNQVACSPDGKLIALNIDTQTEIWDVAAKAKRLTLDGAGYRTCVAFSPDGGVVVTGDDAGTFRVTETTNFQRVWTSESEESIQGLAIDSQGARLATAKREGGVQVWNFEQFQKRPKN